MAANQPVQPLSPSLDLSNLRPTDALLNECAVSYQPAAAAVLSVHLPSGLLYWSAFSSRRASEAHAQDALVSQARIPAAAHSTAAALSHDHSIAAFAHASTSHHASLDAPACVCHLRSGATEALPQLPEAPWQLAFAGPAMIAAVGSFGLKMYRVSAEQENGHLSVVLVGERKLRETPSVAFFSYSASIVVFGHSVTSQSKRFSLLSSMSRSRGSNSRTAHSADSDTVASPTDATAAPGVHDETISRHQSASTTATSAAPSRTSETSSICKTCISGYQLSQAGMTRLPATEVDDALSASLVQVACPYRRVLLCIAIPKRQSVALYRFFKDAVDCVSEVHMPGFAERGLPLHMSCTSDLLIFHAANGDASAVLDPLSTGPVAPPLPMVLPDAIRCAKASNPEHCEVAFTEPDVAIIKAPTGEGVAFRVALDLESLAATSTDLPLLMNLLQRRSTSGARSLSLRTLRSIILEGDERGTRRCLSTLARAHASGGPSALEPKVVCEEVLKPTLGVYPSRAVARRVHHAAVEYASLLAHLATTSSGSAKDCPPCVWEVAVQAASFYSPEAAANMAAESPAPAPRHMQGAYPKLAARSARAHGGERAARCLVRQGRPVAALREVRKAGKRVHVPSEVLHMADTMGPVALCPALRFATIFCSFRGLSEWLPNVYKSSRAINVAHAAQSEPSSAADTPEQVATPSDVTDIAATTSTALSDDEEGYKRDLESEIEAENLTQDCKGKRPIDNKRQSSRVQNRGVTPSEQGEQ